MSTICIVCIVFIVLDILSGVVAGAKNKELSSTKMRTGLYNKIGELLLIGVAGFCEFILTIEPFSKMGIPPEILYTVVIYIAGMELLSILENICKINTNIPIAKILAIFEMQIDKEKENKLELNQAPKE